ncbi:hypothetical protein LTR37_005109 [Vermiconidia calcicola]|uniref:Uncharacterized protein n=1 Tax=Vermiconidia calcicola TaxID=1690605 RepID=A0ACC3NK65_9PEZI|nr:hypothetical protein LTR37_005109 [Vermiconidia calcicola]
MARSMGEKLTHEKLAALKNLLRLLDRGTVAQKAIITGCLALIEDADTYVDLPTLTMTIKKEEDMREKLSALKNLFRLLDDGAMTQKAIVTGCLALVEDVENYVDVPAKLRQDEAEQPKQYCATCEQLCSWFHDRFEEAPEGFTWVFRCVECDEIDPK